MAYKILSHQSLQTATNAAATVTAGIASAQLFDSADDAEAFFNELKDGLFEELAAEAKKNNEELEAEAAKSGNSSSARGGSRGRSSGGGRSNSGGSGSKGKKKFTPEEAGEIELRFGAFTGCTIAEVFDMDEDAAEEYGYGKAGVEWLKWAEESAQSDYLKDAIKAYLSASEAA